MKKKKRKATKERQVRSFYMSQAEAKEAIKAYYKRVGHQVKRISADTNHAVMRAYFGVDQSGKGLGPWGLSAVTLNWPKRYDTRASVGFLWS